MGVTLPILTIILAFANLFGTGGAPLFSMARGAGETNRAGRILGNVFSMLIGSGLVLMAVIYLVKRPLLYLFGASDDTFPYADAYLTLYLIGTPFVMISLGLNGFINAQGFAVTGMLTVSIGAVLNLILDPVFIFLFHLGVRGAAIATVISQCVSALWVLRFLTGKQAIIPLVKENLKVHWRLVAEICKLGLAGFIMAITNSTVQIVCNATLRTWGGDLYVAIMTAVNSVREILMMPMQGLSSGAQPVMSFNYGAKRYDRVKTAIRYTAVVCVVYSLIAWALLLGFPRFFLHLFNSDPALLNEGVPAMHIYFFGIFLMALQMAGQSAFVALGRSKHAIFFSLLRKAIIVVPLTLWLPTVGGLGTDGVFLAEPISNLIGGVACFTTMVFTVKKMLEDEA
jgi:putative MATE family efflux protein